MDQELVLLVCDQVDSTGLAACMGDAEFAALSMQHDRVARELLARWDGREIDKSDGFLLIFSRVDDAIGWSASYHDGLRRLAHPMRARVGIHQGSVFLEHGDPEAVARGAKPVDLHGLTKAITARIAQAASAGQTLLSEAARGTLCKSEWQVCSHGHWQMAGLRKPLEIFEVLNGGFDTGMPVESRKCYRVVRAGDEWVPAVEVPCNLPAERDWFVGRAIDLAHLTRLFDRGARLVTLHGMGGIGKTRLAQRFGLRQRGLYTGGIWFCDVSSATDEGGFLNAVAVGIKLPSPSAATSSSIGELLARLPPTLVILDSLDRVARESATILGGWMEQAPSVSFLVTSRVLLSIAGETPFDVDSLDTNAAYELFRCRSGVVPDSPSKFDEKVQEIVDLLNGLPLAIEIAAARARVLAPDVLLHRLKTQSIMAARNVLGVTGRHATLRAALDWSWDSLDGLERTTLLDLTAFDGGFTVEAAELVLPQFHLEGVVIVSGIDVESCLAALVDKSMLRRDHEGRFGFLSVIEQYLNEKYAVNCDEDNRGRVRARHLKYCLSLTRAHILKAGGADARNLLRACRSAQDGGLHDASVHLLESAWLALSLRGPLSSGESLAEKLLCQPGLSGEQRIEVFRLKAEMASAAGRVAEAQRCGRHALELAELGGKPAQLSRVLCTIGSLEGNVGFAENAVITLRRAVDLGDVATPLRRIEAMNALAINMNRIGSHGEAFNLLGRCAQLAMELEDRRWQGGLLGNMGVLCLGDGRWLEGKGYLEEAISIAAEIGDAQWEGNTRSNLGLALRMLCLDEAAEEQFNRALDIGEKGGFSLLVCTSLCNLGAAYLEMAKLIPARECLERALRHARLTSLTSLESFAAANLGLLRARQGAWAISGQLFDLARQKAEATRDIDSMVFYQVQRARAALDEGATELALTLKLAIGESIADNTSKISAETQWVIGALEKCFQH